MLGVVTMAYIILTENPSIVSILTLLGVRKDADETKDELKRKAGITENEYKVTFKR